jgi:hypothetical protein
MAWKRRRRLTKDREQYTHVWEPEATTIKFGAPIITKWGPEWEIHRGTRDKNKATRFVHWITKEQPTPFVKLAGPFPSLRAAKTAYRVLIATQKFEE